jgi:hypothetical protein
LFANSVSEKFAKKFLGESDIEDILQRLDRLTVDEARMTGTQTLRVVHGLMKLGIDGMELLLGPLSTSHDCCTIDGKASVDGLQEALRMFAL